MRPDQIAHVERSFRVIAPLGEMAAAIFYERLFTMDPAMHRLFRHADMGEQGRKLMAALGFVVNNLREPDRLLPAAAELGRRHAGYGVQPSHYDTVGAALLDTLAEGLGDGFSPPVRDAWEAAYRLLAGTMQAGAAPARAA
ncbi:hemin receptor [Falsiroseomonas bella]|uniref:Hemin receptor n=1 Tax=Falsiroseomonas bella TaxID=2184016 RepID=A0A317FBK8_9PROT|nr:globin family protein [Falsiroseomonas bella]PWS36245.1 hemin receptor [Falsiroseomonas bella]